MKHVSRRNALGALATTGIAALAPAAAQADAPAAKKRKLNAGPAAPGTTKPDSHGPREMFAVVDSQGTLIRGLHAVSSRQVDVGVYEVSFARDVRRGAYLATIGGPGYVGVPLAGSIAVMGLASDPKGVFVYTSTLTGSPLATGFHLLVICPEGYA